MYPMYVYVYFMYPICNDIPFIFHYYRKLYAVHVWTALLCIQYFMRLTYEFVCSFIIQLSFILLPPFSFLFHLPPVRFLSSSLYAPFSSNSPLLPLPSPIPPFLYSSLHFLSSRPPPPISLTSFLHSLSFLSPSPASLSSPLLISPLSSFLPFFHLHSFPTPSSLPSSFRLLHFSPFSFLHCSSLSGTHSLTHLPPLSSV